MNTTPLPTPPLRTALVLHGGGGPRTVAPIVTHLEPSFRVIAPTHPGWDGNDRPSAIDSVHALATAYLEQLRDAGERDVLLVGSSIGGWLALEMAVIAASDDRFGDVVGAVVDIDGVGTVVDGEPIADFFSMDARQLAEAAWHDPDSGYTDPALLTEAQRAVQQSNGAAMAAVAGRSMSDPDLLGRLGGLRVPVLVLFGESDRIVTPAHGRVVAAAIPGAEFAVVPAAGHLPHLEEPLATWALLDPFVARS